MVSANDNNRAQADDVKPVLGAAGNAIPERSKKAANVGSAPNMGEEAKPATPCAGGTKRPSRTYTVARVTDDLGEHIEVRAGEITILGPLIDSVLEELRAKQANER